MIATLFQILGGLALFLLAMEMMTNGLKSAAGHHLRHLLGHWTKTPLRGLAAGFLITGLVQSSGAVTVATIGFVNAGLLSLSQSLGVIFGSNIGTTMTAWLVSLVGFGFNIEAIALPILAAGVGLKLISGNPRSQSLGEALAGFALFFLGLSILKSSLESFTGGMDSSILLQNEYGLPAFMLIGFLATVVTQSSSAALAIVLTAAAGGLIPLNNAAAAVIGANLGSTSTAALSAIKATANARRLAIGHILFNAVTGAIALLILPLMLWTVALLADWLQLDANVAVSLALFHTLFNVLGAFVMLPFTPHFARFLGRLFRSREEDLAEPRFLDNTLVTTPELAVSAVDQEMKRLIDLNRGLLRVCLDREGLKPAQIGPKSETCLSLNQSITDYVSKLRAEKIHPATVDALTRTILTCRYLAEATNLAPALLQLRESRKLPQLAGLSGELEQYVDLLRALVSADETAPVIFNDTEKTYHMLKSRMLAMIVKGDLSAIAGERTLDTLSSVRRLCDQWHKSLAWRPATELLNGESHAQGAENRI
ncbi:Na/Pi cotransporter [Marinobacter vulgaris]|uniref:Na/Pi cotransporter n=1 Tax=Marinobacter vulgaris TaxID=1928331 RepID=A0A2V3ZPI2_9GAMM|nr:Na/Pi cotransporter family protein [Marinobacter vulgaris]PXX93307.1 Na/Pi cotransporter [Marinobacter vulgaris]TSJ72681.1 Na/Pi cotransporter family protein [Marinobacter vulgaris]